ncbi:hypothetical protein CLV71_111189 [Actinophytocola oryzae]|uniref:Uncharacterized protein n=2 Tax=Actinophytocola oryzae TaxID=502181 RepID=A0A4V3FS64_9PSEU|nr:hypothetical protein CLV71_111189 [Actinophytocola oryzae]
MILVPTLALALVGAAEPVVGTAAAETDPQQQLLYYNHSYGVFDRETADAIEHSEYLPEFANFSVRTSTGTGGVSWTGRYLMGRETYVELFGVGDLPDQDGTLGSTGLGLSTERAGQLPTVAQRMADEGGTPIGFIQMRDFGDGVPVPWFDAVLVAETYDSFSGWAMEYRPEYFADPRGNTEPENYPGDVGRERYLSDAYRDHLMRDVTGIRIAMTRRDLDATVPLLRAGDFAVHTYPGGILATRGGTTMRFDAVPRESAGMKRIEFSLNRPVLHRHVEQLGNSTLVVGPGARAVWTFR